MKPLATRAVYLSLVMATPLTPALGSDCSNAQTQVAINECMQANYANADQKLNALYQRLMDRLQAPDAKQLRDAQRSWVAFRDKHCAFVAKPNTGGSIYPSIFASCLEKATSARAAQLHDRLHCKEGDLGCGS